MRQGLAPSPWKKRVVSIGHLLLPFLDCRAVLAHAAGLALNHPFGAFSLAPLSFAVVGNCVGVQEYKGSFFLSFSQPALSFACHLTSLLHVLPFLVPRSLCYCAFSGTDFMYSFHGNPRFLAWRTALETTKHNQLDWKSATTE